jgi:putative endonuclease
MNSKNTQTGLHGETLVANYLQEKGWEIVVRNWRFHPYELDLVAKKAEMMLFVEVKTFENSYVLPPEQKVNRSKFRFLTKAAVSFLEQRPFEGEIRFDLFYVILRPTPAEIIHYEDVWFPNNWGRY